MMMSVVIPVYNVELYLQECIDSVLKQTFTDYEIILVDDGSTDNSRQICDCYAEQYSQICVIHQENGGLSAARNVGLDAAQGEFIYFLDSDDYIAETCLEKTLEIAIEENADVVFFDSTVFFTNCESNGSENNYARKYQYETGLGRIVLDKLIDMDEYRTAVPLHVFRKEYLQKNNLRFMEGILYEDELFTFLVYHANGKVSHCHEKLYRRRVRPGSIMTAANLCRQYESAVTIYYELEKYYKEKKTKDAALLKYMIRTSKYVLSRYQLLSDSDRIKYFNSLNEFKKSVMKMRGYGDRKLQIKCTDGISNLWYRFLQKVENISLISIGK